MNTLLFGGGGWSLVYQGGETAKNRNPNLSPINLLQLYRTYKNLHKPIKNWKNNYILT